METGTKIKDFNQKQTPGNVFDRKAIATAVCLGVSVIIALLNTRRKCSGQSVWFCPYLLRSSIKWLMSLSQISTRRASVILANTAVFREVRCDS